MPILKRGEMGIAVLYVKIFRKWMWSSY